MLRTLLLPRGGSLPGLVLPYLVGGAALAVAFVGSLLTGDASGTDGVNGFVERLSGRSSSFLGDLGLLAPLGFAFTAGMAATVNPCGFAMLPAYLGLYLGSNENREKDVHPLQRLGKALVVSGIVTVGFIMLFGITGVAISEGARSLVDIFPWVGLSIGVILAVVGSWMLGGGKLYSGLAGRVGARIGDPSEVGIRGYFLFGVSYGTASLSCTLPIFLVVVSSTIAVSGFLAGLGQFVLYALGMGVVITALTIGIALFKGAVVSPLRKILPYTQPISAAMMIVAGSYIVFYWLTLGGLL